VRAALARAHRDEWGKVFGSLVRYTGDWNLAEDCTQDAFERALERWPAEGIPRSPGAWLTVTARHRALDILRRATNEHSKLRELGDLASTTAPAADAGLGDRDWDGDEWQDERLRLLFTCCHPALPMEGRVALTLRTVAGLDTREIARAFLVSEATVSQRILRAKRKIANAGIPYRVPPPELIEERTAGVLAVVYLLFNEGYSASDGRLVRDDLSTEAIRLARMLVELLPDDDDARGLFALLLLQQSRRAARVDAGGDIVTLDEQDRRLWDRSAITEALAVLGAAAAHHDAGGYTLQAAIAAEHAKAGVAADTDWAAILALYDRLLRRHPSPVIALNRVVALGQVAGLDAALAALEQVASAPELVAYPLLPAVRADALHRAGRFAEAAKQYRAARVLAPSDAERRLFDRRIAECRDRVPR
jgi:RNA polymerase sigma-70 factor (ECF subfamily)